MTNRIWPKSGRLSLVVGAAVLGSAMMVPTALAAEDEQYNDKWSFDVETFNDPRYAPELREPIYIYVNTSVTAEARPTEATLDGLQFCYQLPVGVEYLQDGSWVSLGEEGEVCTGIEATAPNAYSSLLTVRATTMSDPGKIVVRANPTDGPTGQTFGFSEEQEGGLTRLPVATLDLSSPRRLQYGEPSLTLHEKADRDSEVTSFAVPEGDTARWADGIDAHQAIVTTRNQWGAEVPAQGHSVTWADTSRDGVAYAATESASETETAFAVTSTSAGQKDLRFTLDGASIPSSPQKIAYATFADPNALFADVELIGESALANGEDSYQVDVTVKNARGEIQPGKTVEFDYDNNLFQYMAPRAGGSVTDANGVASMKFASKTPGKHSVRVVVDGATVTGSPTVLEFGAVDAVTPSPDVTDPEVEKPVVEGKTDETKADAKSTATKGGALASTGAGLAAALMALPLLGLGALLVRRFATR